LYFFLRQHQGSLLLIDSFAFSLKYPEIISAAAAPVIV